MIADFIENEFTRSLNAVIGRFLTTPESELKISEIASQKSSPVFNINLDSLRREFADLLSMILNRPTEVLRPLEKALKEAIRSQPSEKVQESYVSRVRITFSGNFGNHSVTARGLKSNLVNKMVKLVGIVTSASSMRVRAEKTVQINPVTKHIEKTELEDLLTLRFDTNKDFLSSNINKYSNDDDKVALEVEYGLSQFKDVQFVIVQEAPENVPSGLLSRSVEVILQEDMVDSIKPGDRVEIVGIFQAMPGIATERGLFRQLLLALDVLTRNSQDFSISPDDIAEIRKVARRPDVLPLIFRSIAPAIEGHGPVKEGIALQLMGGVERVLETGTRLRGDINILMVGDPSTAKSQLLRRMMTLAPLSFSTTGRGSTGVGLTAAVTRDRESGERTLEAGAMVLADRGVICVDEFDKMSTEDRTAMHEAMEQQTVTLAKAGIHVTLNARCSILAAANPVFGNYIASLPPAKNIDIVESLLSRFDLIFLVIDRKDPQVDRLVARRVASNHRIVSGPAIGAAFSDRGVMEAAPQPGKDKVFEPFNQLLHPSRDIQYLTQAFLKKYIAYAKELDPPQLLTETSQYLKDTWVGMRQKDYDLITKYKKSHIVPVATRSLESLIRLSCAYAKLRLAKTVTLVDAARAVLLYLTAFFGGENAEGDFAQLYEETRRLIPAQEDTGSKPKQRAQSKTVEKKSKPQIIEEEEPEKEEKMERSQRKKPIIKDQHVEIDSDDYKKVFKAMIDFKKEQGMIAIDDFWNYLQTKKFEQTSGVTMKTRKDLIGYLTAFQNANKIVFDQLNIYSL